MHAQLRNAAVNSPDACRCREHRAYCASAPAVVADLENLQLGVLLARANVGVDAALKNGGANGISSHVRVRICRDSRSNVQARGVILEVCIEEVGVDGVNDIAGNQEGVCIGARQSALDLGFGELLYDALNNNGKEIATRALAKKRANFLVIEEGDDADLGGAR